MDGSIQSIDLADGSVTASKLAESYLLTTGGTLTGNLNMENSDITMSDGKTVDGVDVSALKEQVGRLLPGDGNQITTTYISDSIKPFAYGSVSKSGTLTNNYKIESVTIASGYEYEVYFSTTRGDTNYSILVTPTLTTYPCVYVVKEKNNDGFILKFFVSGTATSSGEDIYNFYTSSDAVDFDFVVFANNE